MIITRDKLFEDLSTFAKDEFKLPTLASLNEYTTAMLRYIGDPDAVLRDELISSTFYEWIGEKKYYTEVELKTLLQLLLDENHLFYGIGNEEDDKVFTRTFSLLIVGLILDAHKKCSFLSPEEFVETKNSVLKYYMQEKDLRGYMNDKGWAHGAAHGADAMDELIDSQECDEQIVQEILTAIRLMLHNGNTILHFEEDERIARPVYRMIRQGKVNPIILKAWLKEVCDCISGVGDMKLYKSRVNSKNFVRCLYFRLVHFQVNPEFLECILDAEKKLNRYVIFDRNI